VNDRTWKRPSWWLRPVARISERLERRINIDPEESVDAANTALEWVIKRWGPDSMQAVNGHRKLAKYLESTGQLDEAVLHRRAAFESIRDHMGPEDMAAVDAEFWLATDLVKLDRPGDAKPLLEHVVEAFTRDSGLEDEGTLLAMEWLGCAQLTLGEPEAAKSLLERTVSTFELTGKGDSETCMVTTAHLARACDALDQYDRVIQLRRHILATRSRKLGPDDPRTLKSLRDLSVTLLINGDLAEARVLAASLVDAHTRLSGEEGSDASEARALLEQIEDEAASD
jgi:hypothetical protein